MLRGHFLLGNRNYSEIEKRLAAELKRLEKTASEERSEQVRTTLDQNSQILQQRITKARQLSEPVRLIEARLRVVSDSLQLIQDEVYSMTDVRGVSDVVDELLVKLEMNDEFRSYYDDILTEGSPALAALDSDVDLQAVSPAAQVSDTPASRHRNTISSYAKFFLIVALHTRLREAFVDRPVWASLRGRPLLPVFWIHH